jgi:hypothetical protein
MFHGAFLAVPTALAKSTGPGPRVAIEMTEPADARMRTSMA